MVKPFAFLCALLLCASSFAGYYQLKPVHEGNRTGGEYYFWENGGAGSGTLPYYNHPYGGYGGGYNASPAGGTVDCYGEITVVFEWVRDELENEQPDPLDEPPLKVIVREYCSAKAGSDGGAAAVDNGLGHADQVVGTTHEATGVRLKVVAGGNEITVKCEPSASASSSTSAYASVEYSVMLIAPVVKWEGTTPFFDDSVTPQENAHRFLTGQKVRASIDFVLPPGTAMPAEFTHGSWQWTLPTAGMPFKNYVPTNNSGVKYDLTADDLDNATFEFFTVDNGEIEQEVTFTITPVGAVTLEGSGEISIKSYKVESVRPKLDSYQSGLGSVDVHTYGPNIVLELAGSLGPSGAGPGIRVWDIKYKVEHFELKGYGAIAQLITPSRELTVQNFDGSTTLYTMDYSGTEGLDHSFPYEFDDQWTLPALGSFRDSPGLNLSYLSNTISGSANDSFKTWFMYRPSSKDGMPTCWIPISMFKWDWSGIAQKQTKWSLGAHNQNITQFPTNSLVHPEWSFFFQPHLYGFSPL